MIGYQIKLPNETYATRIPLGSWEHLANCSILEARIDRHNVGTHTHDPRSRIRCLAYCTFSKHFFALARSFSRLGSLVWYLMLSHVLRIELIQCGWVAP